MDGAPARPPQRGYIRGMRMRSCVVVAALALGYPAPAEPATSPTKVPAANIIVFEGACDASGAVPLGGSRFIVADDEDNVLRIYDARRGGAALAARDLSPELALPLRKRPPEADIEAATGLDEVAFWLASHGSKKSGKRDASRLRFFATTMPRDGSAPELVGEVYSGLLDDLAAAPQLARFELAAAAARPPQERGGLNIEGMTGTPDRRSVVIGFRSPVPGGKALAVPLLNPRDVIAQRRARFGEPILLDLGGLGVRSLSWWRGRYLLIAGGVASEARSRLFTWRGGPDAPVAVDAPGLGELNPEAFVTDEASDEILVLSDDGSAQVDGTECKRLKDPARKRFRGLRLRLPRLPPVTAPGAAPAAAPGSP
jgi:hypothetical protein